MKRILTLFAALFFAAVPVVAQNNPYAIDDECYPWYSRSEQVLDDFGSDDFEEAQEKLLQAALRTKDTKAQTLYYVQRLKRSSHLAQHERKQRKTDWDSVLWNARVEQDREVLQRVAKATGYMQYFHYANELCQTYYFNTLQDFLAEEMLLSAMREARETGDRYAMWKAEMYLGKLHQRISDITLSRKYFKEAVESYKSSDDPTIRRQGITLLLCDLADTYPVASDSARMFFRMAEESVKTRADSVKAAYYKAQLAAWDGDAALYRHCRDYCLSHPGFPKVVHEGRALFTCVDNILAHKPLKAYISSLSSLYLRQQFAFVSGLAIKLHQWEAASAVFPAYVDRLYHDIYSVNSQKLDYMSTQYEQHRLSTEIESMSLGVKRAKAWIAVLLGVIVLESLAFALLYLRIRKKNSNKKETI